jgi:shikimate kinase
VYPAGIAPGAPEAPLIIPNDLIVLIGMPGCGKSTIGRQLARMRQFPFVDSDHEIERYLGCSIREFFEREGEAAFRDIESRVLRELVEAAEPRVLATGGGAVLRPANRQVMRGGATVVYLKATPDDLARRLHRDTSRPLLQVADPRQRLRDLFAERDPLYRETAHLTIDTARKSAATIVSLLAMQLELAPAPASRQD